MWEMKQTFIRRGSFSRCDVACICRLPSRQERLRVILFYSEMGHSVVMMDLAMEKYHRCIYPFILSYTVSPSSSLPSLSPKFLRLVALLLNTTTHIIAAYVANFIRISRSYRSNRRVDQREAHVGTCCKNLCYLIMSRFLTA